MDNVLKTPMSKRAASIACSTGCSPFRHLSYCQINRSIKKLHRRLVLSLRSPTQPLPLARTTPSPALEIFSDVLNLFAGEGWGEGMLQCRLKQRPLPNPPPRTSWVLRTAFTARERGLSVPAQRTDFFYRLWSFFAINSNLIPS